MPKISPPDFRIHVDSSCLTTSTDLGMPPERVTSSETIVRHDSWEESEEISRGEGVQQSVGQEDLEAKAYIHSDTDRAREKQIDRIEAHIQAAARAVVASIEQSSYHGEESVLSSQTDSSEGSLLTSGETELTYIDGTEPIYGTEASFSENEHEQEGELEGDSSSHHDGDIDDDIFSRNSGHSARSSLNSCHLSSDEMQGKQLTSPIMGEEAIQSSPGDADDTISRISSYTPRDTTQVTPSKVLARPPFRTPSSVRAMQMSSPTPSLFSSPRSTKRYLPPVSRIGTPTSFSSPTRRTPTRFKGKRENPLVLLQVTVIPLTWAYSHIIDHPELPTSLEGVKSNWELLQDKVNLSVLERGVLISHPKESYEVLEERILEALELPIRPRAMILKCGHYIGPDLSSDEDDEMDEAYSVAENGTCTICAREIRMEDVELGRKRKFRVKIYASNGWMTAGAWAACWEQMERIEVEIEPLVESAFLSELKHFSVIAMKKFEAPPEDDGFADEQGDEADDFHAKDTTTEEEMSEEQRVAKTMEQEEEQILTQREDEFRRKILEEERMQEIYGTSQPSRSSSPLHGNFAHVQHGDSLLELLLAAFKVAMRDRKNVIICVLSILVLLLALRGGSTPHLHHETALIRDNIFDGVVGSAVEPSTTLVGNETPNSENIGHTILEESFVEVIHPDQTRMEATTRTNAASPTMRQQDLESPLPTDVETTQKEEEEKQQSLENNIINT
jgi:hypothetical protein